MKYKIAYLFEENGKEYYKVLNNEENIPAYVARELSYADRPWYYTTDPINGYGELDFPIENTVKLVICNVNGEEFFPVDRGKPFETMKEAILKEWESVTVMVSPEEKMEHSYREWIMTYFSKESMEKMKPEEKMSETCAAINWASSIVETDRKVLHSFSYFGIPMCISESTYMHMYCGVSFRAFQCARTDTKTVLGYQIGHLGYILGYIHPKEEGDMMP